MDQNLEYKNALVNKFKEFESSLNGEKNSALHKIRLDALANFSQMNVPTTHDEDWRFTNLAPIFKGTFNPSIAYKKLDKKAVNSSIYSKLDCPILVFVNGIYSEELSKVEALPKQISLLKISDLYAEDGALKTKDFFRFTENKNIFSELNTAFANEGIFLSVPRNFTPEAPIYILNIADSGNEKYLIQPRSYFLAGKNSQIHIIEHFISVNNDEYFTNALTNFHLAENSIVRYTRLQEESSSSFHMSNTNIDVEKDASFSSHLVSLGGKIARNNINVKFRGEGGYASLNGLYLTDGEQLFDAHTVIDHDNRLNPDSTNKKH